VKLLKIGLKEWRSRVAVSQNGGKKWVLDACARLRGGFRHDILEFPDRFDILLKKKAQRRS
jgi:hypothetical protein